MSNNRFRPPEEVLGSLFKDLHESGLYKDGKVISDAIPREKVKSILLAYKSLKQSPTFDLRSFFEENFILAYPEENSFKTDLSKSAREHIKSLWSVLKRKPQNQVKDASLIQLPFPYIVPGGRFNEVYYWDSYFTMLGLAIQDEWETIENMINNFAWLIDKIGFIPNGNRTYFLGRSQPPFFSLMVELLADKKGDIIYLQYKEQLQKEYDFWMLGSDQLKENGSSHSHVVKLDDYIVNRYYDKYPSARGEMYQDDLDLLKKSGRTEEDLFANVRAACESGWDFSSRWFSDYKSLEKIRCSDIIPVDLNCLLYHLENTLSKTYKLADNPALADTYITKAEARKEFIHSKLWNEKEGTFSDFSLDKNASTESINLACTFPLFLRLCTDEQSDKIEPYLKKHLERPGGFVTTPINSGQQWDAPNGWAPLQWIAIKGLHNYGHEAYAKEMAQRWISLNEKVYAESGKFVEKYNVEDLSLEAAGGEYAVQDGFGWSNGVYLALKNFFEPQ